jgi:RNA polymerase sigma-70 factor (ECF subfamily)
MWESEVDAIFRRESGSVIATLIRRFGSIDLAEESVQDAFVIALQRWRKDGLPANPGGWITTTSRNIALNVLRRESTRDDRQRSAMSLYPSGKWRDSGPLGDSGEWRDSGAMGDSGEWRDSGPLGDSGDGRDSGPLGDDRLRLIFTCCHPSLAPAARIALTLRLLGGLQTAQIARAFLVSETTMAQRLVRAKRKIQAANIPYRVPEDSDLPPRLSSVLSVLYLIFNEGYISSEGDELIRYDLCEEAIRLARLLTELMRDEPEALGLLAMLLLIDARRPSRVSADGSIVLLADQDRSLWDWEKIEEGMRLTRRLLRRGQRGPFQIQAAINAVHSDAASFAETDWGQILACYDQLIALTPTRVVAMNRAVALAETAGPEAALEALEGLDLDHYQPFHSTRGEMLMRLGRAAEARKAYEAALALTTNAQERRFLERRLQQVE